MRIARLSFALAAGLIGVACGGETPEPKPPAPPPVATTTPPPAPTATEAAAPAAPQKSMPAMQAEAIKVMTDGFVAGDAKKVASIYADDAVMMMPGMPEAKGRAAIEKDTAQFFAAVSKLKMAATRVFTKDDTVIAEWAMNGVHTGDFMGVKATEKPVGWHGATLMKFNKDGKVTEDHTYFNMPTMMAQIGAIKGMKARAVPELPASPEMVTFKAGDKDAAHKALVEKMNGAMASKKEADFVGGLADNIEWDDVAAPGPTKGKDGAKKYFKMFTAAFGDMKSDKQDVWVFGDYVVQETKWTATHKGTFMGIPATKKPVTMHGLDVMKVEGDKIVKGWSYDNGAELMMQIAPEKMGPKPGDAKAAPKADAKAAPKAAAKPAPKK